MSSTPRRPLQIEVWSDIACPWCWVGKRHLEAAIAELHETSDTPIELRWRAFELNPSAGKNLDPDVDYVERLASKYMTSRAQAQSMIDRMTQTGAERGLEFRFDRVRPGNTFDGHRLLAWAADTAPELQDRLKERLLRAYMNEGAVIWDVDTLTELAADAGLDPDGARAVLAGDGYRDEVRADESLAGDLGVTGVPFFVIDRRVALQGAQPPELLLKALRKAEELRGEFENDLETDAGDACGPDGCAI